MSLSTQWPSFCECYEIYFRWSDRPRSPWTAPLSPSAVGPRTMVVIQGWQNKFLPGAGEGRIRGATGVIKTALPPYKKDHYANWWRQRYSGAQGPSRLMSADRTERCAGLMICLRQQRARAETYKYGAFGNTSQTRRAPGDGDRQMVGTGVTVTVRPQTESVITAVCVCVQSS